MIGVGYHELRLRPFDNGYLTIPDPADRIVTCPACGCDHDPSVPHDCDPGDVARMTAREAS